MLTVCIIRLQLCTFKRIFTIFVWPYPAALCNGVLYALCPPALSFTSMFSCDNNLNTSFSSPLSAASCRPLPPVAIGNLDCDTFGPRGSSPIVSGMKSWSSGSPRKLDSSSKSKGRIPMALFTPPCVWRLPSLRDMFNNKLQLIDLCFCWRSESFLNPNLK